MLEMELAPALISAAHLWIPFPTLTPDSHLPGRDQAPGPGTRSGTSMRFGERWGGMRAHGGRE